MFFNRNHGEARPLARVRKAAVRKDEVHLSFDDGDSMTVTVAEWDGIARDTVQHMIPAQPGTYSLSVVMNFEDGGDPVFREVVVGWAVCADGFVYPVTSRGVNAGDAEDRAVLHPNGTVESAYGTWPSVELWAQDEMEKLRRKASLASA